MQKKPVDIDSPQYPALLKKIDGAPKKLFYRGNWNDALFNKCLAVVGSRKMTPYGKAATEKLIFEVAGGGVTIVSGFMYGIDAAAHRTALDAGGKTIAVLGGGVDCVYPPDQFELYREIIDSGGLVLSEYDGAGAPAPWSFPQRNRIVSGLAHAVLVVEAEQASGSLITAKLAIKQKRKLFAVPRSIFAPTSRGTLELLSAGKAQMVLDCEVVLDFFGVKKDFESRNGILEALNDVS